MQFTRVFVGHGTPTEWFVMVCFLSMCMLKDQAEAVGWANLLELTAKR